MIHATPWYSDVIMSTMASQITSLTIVYSTGYSGADQRKHQSSASLAFVRGIHRSPVNSPHKGPVTRKMYPFDDVVIHATLQSSHDSWWWPGAYRCTSRITHHNGNSNTVVTKYFISVTSHESHGVSNHRQLDACLTAWAQQRKNKAPTRRQAIIWTNDGEKLGLSESLRTYAEALPTRYFYFRFLSQS